MKPPREDLEENDIERILQVYAYECIQQSVVGIQWMPKQLRLFLSTVPARWFSQAHRNVLLLVSYEG